MPSSAHKNTAPSRSTERMIQILSQYDQAYRLRHRVKPRWPRSHTGQERINWTGTHKCNIKNQIKETWAKLHLITPNIPLQSPKGTRTLLSLQFKRRNSDHLRIQSIPPKWGPVSSWNVQWSMTVNSIMNGLQKISAIQFTQSKSSLVTLENLDPSEHKLRKVRCQETISCNR